MNISSMPATFGPYMLRRKLASGGMAELFLGETTGPGGFFKPVVIKMIHRDLCNDPRFVEMFVHEAKTVSSFVHGNIVPIFDFGEIEGRTYLAMEFIDGVDLGALSDLCRHHGLPLRPEVSLWVGIGVAAALHYAHRTTDGKGQLLGVVHRDVSPQNILVSRAGEVKLCDFGIALSAASRTSTEAGVIKGKLLYLAPEQARQVPVDHRCDVFSLGVTLYELLAGRHPLSGKAGVSVVRVLSEGTHYPPLEEVASWLPDSVIAAVDKAIQFDPGKRQQSAEELRAELSRALHGEYPGFTPESLADLVRRAQELSEQDTRAGLDSAIRANLASFASEVRRATQTWNDRIETGRRRRRVAKIGLFAGAAVCAAAAVAVFLFGRSSVPFTAAQVAGVSFEPLVASSRTPRFPEVPAFVAPATEPEASSGVFKERTSEARFGFVDLNASPWAEVIIDGVPRGSTPIVGLRLSAGRHTAVLANPDTGATMRRVFVVQPEETVRVIESLDP